MEPAIEQRHVFEQVSAALGIELRVDTHFDAGNYVYSRISGREVQRVDFQQTEDGTYVVTKISERYPAFPRFFRFCHRHIPMFPPMCTVQHERISVLDSGASEVELEAGVARLVKNAL